MQFKAETMNQTQQNSKKHSFGPNFGRFHLNLGQENLFVTFTSTSSLNIVLTYHHMQFKGKLMN